MSLVFTHDFRGRADLLTAVSKRKKANMKERSLPQDPKRRTGKNRAFLSAFSAKGGLTVEAALALPLFMLFVLSVVSFLLILSLQLDIQSAMDETARDLSRKAYLCEKTDFDASLFGPAAVTLKLRTGTLKSRLDNSRVKGGAGGLQAYLSTYDPKTGILDMIVRYEYDIPVLPGRSFPVHFAQRVRSRAWIGRELDSAGRSEQDGKGETEQEDKAQTVYVTVTGSVYHTSKDCHYLDLSIRSADAADIEHLRNKDGSKYGRCPICARYAAANGMVYITDYGENWHVSPDCSGLKRTVMEMDRSEVKNMPVCSKCGKNHS